MRNDREELLHGSESGIVRQLPSGEFIEVHRPMDEEPRAVLEARKAPALPAPGTGDGNGVAAPSSRGAGVWSYHFPVTRCSFCCAPLDGRYPPTRQASRSTNG